MIKVINLHATWCQPCKFFAPVFESVSKMDNYNNFEFQRIDIESDEGFKLCETYHVKSVPTTLVIDENGEELYKILGNAPKTDVTAILNIVQERQTEKKKDEAK